MINTKTHGVIDYLTGALLIVAPYLFDFSNGGTAQILPQGIGTAIILMSLITRYELSAAKLIPLKVHLGTDIASGILLAASPWLFGFAEVIWWPHLVVGLMEILVASITRGSPRANLPS
tara:strand:+ start:172 stop:528 length:357 start_codon:yes stop_codon:yes gene_type:complete